MGHPPLAHSARRGFQPDPYARHVEAVVDGALENVGALMRFAPDWASGLPEAVRAAATFHDLGKLDDDIQAILRRGRSGALRWDHVDAGVAHLAASREWMAAWLVRSHHAPGLPAKLDHFGTAGARWKLRGRRWPEIDERAHLEQIARTDACLSEYLGMHESVVDRTDLDQRQAQHGLVMRIALSCLVDADHSDTAYFDTGYNRSSAPDSRWEERLVALQNYVSGLGDSVGSATDERNRQRSEFFDACLNSRIDAPIVSCEGPVGLGKTTAVTAYLLRRAAAERLRRLIIVAPYTNILNQTADRLRKALVLEGECASDVIVEHHHRAEFESEGARDLAVLWRAPIVLTTAVGFFETLAACTPSRLRKLHSLPGSAIFLDEAHAALPVRLWPQNWRWLEELADEWSCRVVLASGSLSRFWEERTIVGEKARRIPELLPEAQAAVVHAAERRRVRYERLGTGQPVSVDELVHFVRSAPGPRLVILNTVQNAAVVARAMKVAGADVLHLSTALTPRDRGKVLETVRKRLATGGRHWTLVATSCVEAGVDISFRSAFRERFTVASTLQVGGRVNRGGEYDAEGGGVVFDLELTGAGITHHRDAQTSVGILMRMMRVDALNREEPSELVTRAMCEEIRLHRSGPTGATMVEAEENRNYPLVEELGCVIDSDTRLVVVDPGLRERLAQFQPVAVRELLEGSVQLRSPKIDALGLPPAPGRGNEIYFWNSAYEPEFLGVMAGMLATLDFNSDGGAMV